MFFDSDEFPLIWFYSLKLKYLLLFATMNASKLKKLLLNKLNYLYFEFSFTGFKHKDYKHKAKLSFV